MRLEEADAEVTMQGLHRDHPVKGERAQLIANAFGDPMGTWIDPNGKVRKDQVITSEGLQQFLSPCGLYDLGTIHGGCAWQPQELQQMAGYGTRGEWGYLVGRFFIEFGKDGMSANELKVAREGSGLHTEVDVRVGGSRSTQGGERAAEPAPRPSLTAGSAGAKRKESEERKETAAPARKAKKETEKEVADRKRGEADALQLAEAVEAGEAERHRGEGA